MEKPIVHIHRRLVGGPGLILLTGLALLSGRASCQPPYRYLLTDADGQAIEISQIEKITTNADLSDDEKRQALRDLGIEDELLIDLLIRDFSGT